MLRSYYIGLFLLILSFNTYGGPFDKLKEGLEGLEGEMNAVVETQLNFPQYSPLGKRIANGEAVYSDTFYWINADGTVGVTNRGWSRVPKPRRHLVYLDRNEAEKAVADASISPEERQAREEERRRIAAEKKAIEDKKAAERKAAQAEENKRKKNYSKVENNAIAIVVSEKCRESYLISAEDEKLVSNQAKKEIKELLDKGLVPKDYANKQIKNYRVMMAGFGYEQYEMCEIYKILAQTIRSQTEEEMF